ncbi:MAG: hypothetical protein CSA58_12500 [Micrococcales bacterium]|nr:MAG: hypothetical protein CSB46_09090 [Micrococcales bacterium]PIE25859.1 MAG: hypothetical protein CSA58_12500 [Micrococcales bacterium]
MPETPLDFTRLWVEFAAPSTAPGDAPDEVFRADLTWLTSAWTCIFGRGCPGIRNGRPTDGCCTMGAHYSEDADEQRVAGWAQKLDETSWQRIRKSRRKGWSEADADGDRKTRVVDGACIFLNDPDFPGGGGCALHHLADRHQVPYTETKPDVCWQLPIRRTYRTVTRDDGSTYQETTIAEYDRRGWGPGGLDLDWYCTGNPQAHVGTEPVFRSLKDELIELIGEDAYAELARLCEQAMAAKLSLTVLNHPAGRSG